jgi:hypothetical protein
MTPKRRQSLQKVPTARQLSVAKPAKRPPKKRDSIRKLSRQSTLPVPSESENSATPSKWRKPPKKQSTVRRRAALGDELSFLEHSVKAAAGTSSPTGNLGRQSSLRRKLFLQKC